MRQSGIGSSYGRTSCHWLRVFLEPCYDSVRCSLLPRCHSIGCLFPCVIMQLCCSCVVSCRVLYAPLPEHLHVDEFLNWVITKVRRLLQNMVWFKKNPYVCISFLNHSTGYPCKMWKVTSNFKVSTLLPVENCPDASLLAPCCALPMHCPLGNLWIHLVSLSQTTSYCTCRRVCWLSVWKEFWLLSPL